MGVKTSITLPKALLRRLDRLNKNRSAVLEKAALAYLANLGKRARDRKDIETVNRNADWLNREAMDAGVPATAVNRGELYLDQKPTPTPERTRLPIWAFAVTRLPAALG